MAKAVSPAVGFNDNVRRRNRNFHVQTEDSGVAHPHIITHLFTDGGRIVKSLRQSYSDIVGEEQLTKMVRERMKAQHVGMLESLKSGEFDALVWGSRVPGAKPATPVVAPVPAPPAIPAPPVSAQAPSPPASSVPATQAPPSAAAAPALAHSVQSAAVPVPAPVPVSSALPIPQRRSTPPLAAKPSPPTRKTMPRIDTTPQPRTKSVPPRRSSRPPPPRSASRPAVINPRDGLLAQTLDEVILRMLSEEQDAKSGS